MRKKIILALVVFALPLVPFSARALTVKLGTVAPEGSPWHDGLQEIASEWQRISGGKIRVRIYPGGVAGDEPDLLRKIRIGQLHAAALTKSGLFALVPEVDLISFPLMLQSDGELDLLIEKIGPEIEAQLEEKGFKVLNWSRAGWVYFFSKEPVHMPEDLKRQKLFFWGSDTEYLELLQRAGFQPVPLAINDLLPSLQTGLVNSFAAPPVAALSFQWFALTKNMADLRWQPLPGATLISMKTWRKIPDELKPRLEKVAFDVGRRLWGRIAELNEEALKVMEEHGLKINKVSPEGVEYWKTLFHKEGGDEFIDTRYGREAFDRVEAILEEYRGSRSP
jgi:TRAP-type C4-dicarboxylate transport system substrate-binding protein